MGSDVVEIEGKQKKISELLLEIGELSARLDQAEHALAVEKEERQILVNKLEDAQNQLLQSEKMASIGQLVAGVAHEINNPSAYIDCNLGKLGEYTTQLGRVISSLIDDEARPKNTGACAEIRELLREIDDLIGESQQGMHRIKEIVKDVKNFARVDESEWQWQLADIHQCLESTLNVVWNELKYKAKVVKQYDELPLVECMPSQISQVLMNLLVNAVHAIKTQGVITIKTGVDGSGWVWVSVADTGEGIAPEHLNRIFDPFFTTKPLSHGTGLGLSLSSRIMQRHGGRIEIESDPGQGSTFQMWLPCQRPG